MNEAQEGLDRSGPRLLLAGWDLYFFSELAQRRLARAVQTIERS
jgi:hypothetical protein